MCLITTQKKPLVATEDIKVYKLLNKDMSTLYVDYRYKPDILLKTQVRQSDDWSCFDDIDYDYLNKNFKGWTRGHKELKCFGQGFHAALSIKRFLKTKSKSDIIFPATVPKGSRYYLDATGLIVSNQIIVHKDPVEL